jgi:DNA polymerase-3 subunit epsilon
MIQDLLQDRPLCVFDCEGTGLDIAKDRIVTLAATRFGEMTSRHFFKCNPGITMSDEVIAIHGITNEVCATWEPFEFYAQSLFQLINGCDLLGYNLLNYDVPLLFEEFNRCGIEWSLDGVRIIDAGNVFKMKEERTLSAAVRFYCDREHDGAHSADADVAATLDVLNAQLTRYPDLSAMSIDELATFSKFDDRIDLAGKIVKGKDGRPTYNIGKARGVAVEDDPGFGQWMINRDFSANTKMVLRKIFEEIENKWRARHAEAPVREEGLF